LAEEERELTVNIIRFLLSDTSKETEDQQRLMEALSRTLISSSSLEEIEEDFASELKRLMEIDWAVIALMDRAEGGKVSFLPLSPNISSEWESGDIAYAASPLEWMRQNKRTLVEKDLRKKSQFWTERPLLNKGLTSIAYLPLFSKGEIFGSLIVSSRRPNAYKEKELKLLKYAASQLALPVDNYRLTEARWKGLEERFAMLLDESKRKVEEAEKHFTVLLEETKRGIEGQTFINDLIIGITFSEGISQGFQILTEQLKTKVSFDRLSIATIQGENLYINLSVSPEDSPPKAGEIYPLRDCAASWVIEHRMPNLEEDLSVERQFPIDELHLKHGMRSAIRLPLFTREGVFATLNLASCQPNAYGEKEKRFLEQLSIQLAPTIEKIYLRSKERERMEYLTAIAHEVKTPLTAIISSSKLLEEEMKRNAPESPKARLIENVAHSAQTMEGRLAHFLDLATIQDANFRLPAELLDIKPVLQHAALEVISTAQSNNQSLILELSESLPQVRANSQRLEQVMLILLNNAVTLSPQGERITLRARKQDTRLVVEVQDSGTGFSPEEQKELLKPYHPADVEKEKLSQLRLRLAIAKRLVELHGGNMWIESEVEKGSTFAFALPTY
jgi:signal transduction histidine kinase